MTSPIPPSIPSGDGHITRAILTDLFDGKPVTSIHFGGERIFFPQEVAAHLGYEAPRYLVDSITDWTKSGELREGIHFLKVKGQALKDLKAILSTPNPTPATDSDAYAATAYASTNPDSNDLGSLVDKKSSALTVLTAVGLRRVCNLCGTKQGVMFRDWLDTVMDSLDKTGSYTLPPKSPNKNPDAPKAKRASLSPEEREERQRRADAKLLLKYLPELRQGAPHLSDAAYQTVKVKTLEAATGKLIPLGNFLPVLDEPRWHSPAQIAQDLGVPLARVGRAITAAGERLGVDLRGDERYSRCILNQSQHSSKQVPSYLYNDAGRDIITQQLGLDAAPKPDAAHRFDLITKADHPKAQGSLLQSPDRKGSAPSGSGAASISSANSREPERRGGWSQEPPTVPARIVRAASHRTMRGGVTVFQRWGERVLMIGAACPVDVAFPLPSHEQAPVVQGEVRAAWDMAALVTWQERRAEAQITLLEVDLGAGQMWALSWGQARALLGDVDLHTLGAVLVDSDCAAVVGEVLRDHPSHPHARGVLVPLGGLLALDWGKEGSARQDLKARLAALHQDLTRAEVF